jgi:hypothetical protein
MVVVYYRCRLGNHLFQYALGRIIAEHLQFQLFALPILGFPETYQRVAGRCIDFPIRVLNGHTIDLEALLREKSPRAIVLNGFFQRYEYYRAYRNELRNWFRCKGPPLRVEPGTVVVCVRRGDYVKLGKDLSFAFYEQALRLVSFRQVRIVTDDYDDPWLKRFAPYDPVIEPNSATVDFNIIRGAESIVIANSTFHWWGAFLSDADHIVAPSAKLWNFKQVDLTVDEPFWQIVDLP